MAVENVGVLGTGVMGTGVAQVLAQAGYRVTAVDRDPSALDRAKQAVAQNVRLAKLLQKTSAAVGPDEVLSRIRFTRDYDALKDADFIIENVTESWPIKKEAYATIDRLCADHCVFASDTSAIPISRIASATGRPDKVIGLHFMNPVPLKPTVEMIRGKHTSQQTIRSAQNLLSRLGKKWVLINDSPGFVSNRVLMVTINEAIELLRENVADAEQIDEVFRSCFGHKMGPLQTADLIGLDTILQSIEVLHESFGDDKYAPSPLLKEKVAAGRLGRKTGQGFYHYPAPAAMP